MRGLEETRVLPKECISADQDHPENSPKANKPNIPAEFLIARCC